MVANAWIRRIEQEIADGHTSASKRQALRLLKERVAAVPPDGARHVYPNIELDGSLAWGHLDADMYAGQELLNPAVAPDEIDQDP